MVLKRLFFVLQIITGLLPILTFLGYIIKADGDQWTIEHLFATGLALVPFLIVLILRYIFYGTNKN